MIFLKDIDRRMIQQHLGNSLSLSDQIKTGSVGSPGCHIISVSPLDDTLTAGYQNTRCNFEKFERGLLLRINSSNSLSHIVIADPSIKSISLSEETEPKTRFLSLMWIALHLGVPVKKARKLTGWLGEYGVPPVQITIECEGELILESSGFYLYRFEDYFNDYTSA